MNVDPNSFFIDDIFKVLDKKIGTKSKKKIKSVKKCSSKKANKTMDKKKPKCVGKDCFGRKLIQTKKPVIIELSL